MNSEIQCDEELQAGTNEVMRPEFIKRIVYPLASRATGRNGLSPHCMASIVQDRGTGRITVCYHFADDMVVFGKVYSKGLGPHGFELNSRLWGSGFRTGAPYQVPQPLSHLPEYRLLLTMAAEGTPLMSFIGQDNTEVRSYARQAARWLVRLHRTPLQIGRPDSLWDSLRLHKILRRLTKAAAAAPQERKRLIDMVDALCEMGKRGLGQVPAVQSHGRFHCEHIFVNGTTVTLIDFDRGCPSDPAKDLAEFLTILRHRTFQQTGNTVAADGSSQVFLDEYLSELPANGKNLALHWGAFVLESMFKYVKRYIKRVQRSEYDYAAFERNLQFYVEEFDAALSGKFVSRGRGQA